MNDPIADLLKSAKTIAVVGCSANPEKDAHTVPKMMLDKGYKVLPVNPTAPQIFGRAPFKSLSEVREPVDIVNVFRPGPECDKVAEEALKMNPKPRAVWLQLGITNERAKKLCEEADVQFIQDRCMRVEWNRVFAHGR